jgi:hypothetical protein
LALLAACRELAGQVVARVLGPMNGSTMRAIVWRFRSAPAN